MAGASGRTGRDFSTAQPGSGRPRRASFLLLLGLVFGSGPWAGAGAQVLSGELLYTAVQPCRIFDTRFQAAGPLAAGTGRTFHVVGSSNNFTAQGGNAGGCGIPGFVAGGPQAVAVMINLIAVAPQGPGNLRAFPADSAVVPLASVINYTDVNLANGFVLPLRQDSEGSDIVVRADVSGTHVVADVMGFFGPATPRRFYLTTSTHAGRDGAYAVCEAGFHMASLFEILEPSNLVYDNARGVRASDGLGPPVTFPGWVQTGGAYSGVNSAGTGNCAGYGAWIGGFSDHGSWARLDQAWGAAATNTSPWLVGTEICTSALRVWCIEDR